MCEVAYLAIFTFELLSKVIAYGFAMHPTAYLRDAWCQARRAPPPSPPPALQRPLGQPQPPSRGPAAAQTQSTSRIRHQREQRAGVPQDLA